MKRFVQLLRIAEVSKKTTLAKSTIWLKLARQEFVAPARIGGICVWKESDVDDWIESHFQSEAKEAV
ncbi:AlpA family transcriptional regulator [Polynucleobacter sp. MWH-Jannik1A5]|uniref:helix-turn-helix transcriptional regulator n=1 Tax=Polynucleobacter sp. MWH-Jannik1A5 TaxID=1855890 RepID=UPI001C0C3A2C|nr:AlpA family phage regulatory protein [Polynucleobacter sp. MWH-Jannik1A5]MBU3547477.1 AlpA family phage regulatory protein [Polynucleobacter sp. MWH-Jannik1A5]